MVVLAFLSDPEVVLKILVHLGLPTCAPALAVAKRPAPEMGVALTEEEFGSAGIPSRIGPPRPRHDRSCAVREGGD